ncbi:hypothetical protein A0H81_10492 [Grifola frondosa]|uniref:Uncharacterized protein n=1 Tax=Grifola frondosa TaxID=5627 RepID=A0A1C7LZ89_GRIFR|nr:hypothetical protein A0H81_10492 [Grifola frondosa]
MPIADDAERPSELDGSHLDEEPLRSLSRYSISADIVRSRTSCLSTAFSAVSTMSSDVYSHILLFRLPEIYNWRITQHMETIPGPPVDASLEDKSRVFARGLMQEWKWTTVLSGLLLFTSKGLLRVSGVAEDLVANTFGTISMICAFDGLLIGAFYLIAVSNMHGELLRMQNTARFRLTGWRSVPSLLAAPVAWLAWSAISLLALIISYVWHAGATIETESSGHPSAPSYIAHIAVTGVLLTGIVHFVVIVHSVSKMDSVVEQDVVV